MAKQNSKISKLPTFLSFNVLVIVEDTKTGVAASPALKGASRLAEKMYLIESTEEHYEALY